MVNHQLTYIDYLESKKEVDDRSLNRRVFEQFRKALDAIQRKRPVRILEIGAGTGTMLERLTERAVLRNAQYTAVDLNPEFLSHIPPRMEKLTTRIGWERSPAHTDANTTRLTIQSESHQVEIEVIPADIFEFIAQSQQQNRWDMVLAHTVLDIFPLRRVLQQIFTVLRPGGFYYFTLNYDGMSRLLPTVDEQLDRLIERRYHHTMDERKFDGLPIAGRFCGRQLLTYLPEFHAPPAAIGCSDWIVHPGKRGYSKDTETFLTFMIYTIQDALRTDPELNQTRFAEWIDTRYSQVDNHTLTLIAHQLDFFGRLQ